MRGPERRKQPRVEIDAFVKAGEGDRQFVFRTRDISLSGLFLYTKVGHIYPIAVGDTLQLELYDYDQFIELRAKVVRVVRGTPDASDGQVGFGLQILDLSPEAKASLERMIARAAQRKAQ
jgi:c-di-GMP-binding flagellar brake protein YcgR